MPAMCVRWFPPEWSQITRFDALNGFLALFHQVAAYEKSIKYLQEKRTPLNLTGITDQAKAHYIAGLTATQGKHILVVMKNRQAVRQMTQMLSFFGVESHSFGERDFQFYNVEAQSRETIYGRIACLYEAIKPIRQVFLTTMEALTQPILSKGSLPLEQFRLGDTLDTEAFLHRLVIYGYRHEEVAESPGQFSVRGGIIDIFPCTEVHPYRIELFGDEIDSIRIFDEKTQLSLENVQQFSVTTATELLFDDEEYHRILDTLKKKERLIRKETLKAQLQEDLEHFRNERYFAAMDRYLDIIYPKRETFLSYFSPADTIIIADEPLRLSEAMEALSAERAQGIVNHRESGLLRKDAELYREYPEILNEMLAYPFIGLSSVLSSCPDYRPVDSLSVNGIETPGYYGKLHLFVNDIESYLAKGYQVVVPVGSSKLENFKSLLASNGIFAKTADSLDFPLGKKEVVLLPKKGVAGFCYPENQFLLLYDPSIFGNYKQEPKRKKKQGENAITSFADLKIGDYVVHSIHGVGQYVGIEKLVVEKVKRDYLKIRYQGTDCLYIPASQLDTLNKYIGAGERTVRLNKLGGADFSKVKSRVRQACNDLAEKLITLYAEREQKEGYPFSPDTDMQTMFEQTFPYQETEDQLRSIEETKKDMESTRPMDRLLCGDVGYGKTEVAIRAAFKAAADGKQTVYLAPTTVLVQQHYNTFKQRMADFPVNVEMLSRYRTPKQQKEILRKMRSGEIDILIGTHRVLSKDVEYKNLGLLIIDEEQRFGVEHKERIKALKKNIDVLTLTATPIPRTLHMSMLGIRDMSVLSEPPGDRYPVQTYVMEYNPLTIREAIDKEISRGGQVFYLYNRVEGITGVAARVQELCPQARVAVAHGQMSEHEMEKTFIDMLNGEIDVLVCTTIIETGLDIANANTMIVENSDCLGLSQLYQLRGRVGRSNRLAYCYLTYQKNKALTEQSEHRLKAIKEFTEFGSGFKIALRDLEIRGAGNVLGAEQHGHMDAVGYDMYLKILEEAVLEKKGLAPRQQQSARIDIKVNAFLPDTYIKNHDLRMDMYKRISAIRTQKDLSDTLDELMDRFGALPESVVNLTDVAYIKAEAESLNITEINDSAGIIAFRFDRAEDLEFEKISKVAEVYKGRILLNSGNKPGFTYRIKSGDPKLGNIKNILQILK